MVDMVLEAKPAPAAEAKSADATPEKVPAAPAPSVTLPLTNSDLALLLAQEIDAMLRHALGNGTKLPADLLAGLDVLDPAKPPPGLGVLAALHNRLADLVAPATPRTILLLDTDPQKGKLLGAFGPLPNIRRLLVVALLFLSAFIVTSLSDHVNVNTISQNIYTMQGEHLLHVLFFLMSAAGLGACFNALSQAYSYVQAGTYDQRFDSSYWIRIALGIIAGLLISQLVPIGAPGGEAVPLPSGPGPGAAAAGGSAALGKPLLALLGGFSANMVNTVLQRLVETVQALFKGSPADALAAREQALKAKADKQLNQQKLAVAGDLIALREAVTSGAPADRLTSLVGRALEELLPSPADMAASRATPDGKDGQAGQSG